MTSKTKRARHVPLSGSPNEPESLPKQKITKKRRVSCAKDRRPSHATNYQPASMMAVTKAPASATASATARVAAPVTAAAAATATPAGAKRKGKVVKRRYTTASTQSLPAEASLLRVSTDTCRKRKRGRKGSIA
eukprot:TRINITY_DN24487_c0_g1_i2.p1 TRINITY_DN24487_c0_g1~~TRINITY_DN24487_c0_g1_i2.p1  ORF type:complete len:134 (-),score=16.07 TRINITY_DN24487_c0_g1_i2:6-407(-)